MVKIRLATKTANDARLIRGCSGEVSARRGREQGKIGMVESKNIKETMREHKTLFVIIAVALFLLEPRDFRGRRHEIRQAVPFASDGPGRKRDSRNRRRQPERVQQVLFRKKTFGSLDQYRVNLITRERPFPFRAWFVAAVGIPVGIVLLFAFVVKSYVALFHGEESANPASGAAPGRPGRIQVRGSLVASGPFQYFHHRVSYFSGAVFLLGHPQLHHARGKDRHGNPGAVQNVFHRFAA